MISYDEDVLMDGEVYRAILGKSSDFDDASIRYLQPRDKLMKCQVAHDKALDYLFEAEEDLAVYKASLTADEPQ